MLTYYVAVCRPHTVMQPFNLKISTLVRNVSAYFVFSAPFCFRVRSTCRTNGHTWTDGQDRQTRNAAYYRTAA